MKINLIVAMCSNNGIGFKNTIPWHIKSDLKYFSKLTKGNGNNAIIMGYNTWNSLPCSNHQERCGLSGRDNLILTSHNLNFDVENKRIHSFKSVDEILNFLENKKYDEIWVIGGSQLYETFLNLYRINKCYVTYIDKEFMCDRTFPNLDPSVWMEIERNSEYNNENECYINYLVYEKFNDIS